MSPVLRILIALDGLLQRFIPTREMQITWWSAPDYTGNAFHLYRHMLQVREGFTHCWLVHDPATGPRILQDHAAWGDRILPNTVRVVPRHRSLRGYWTFLRSRYIFHTHGMYRVVRSAKGRHIVSLWHGMPIKAIEDLDETSRPTPAFGTLHFACSEPYREIMAAAFRVRVDDVLLAALPRCDVLGQPSKLAPDRDHVRDRKSVV